MSFTATTFLLLLGVFTAVVVTIFLFEYRNLRANLLKREREMTRRMYQLSILRELGERIGYSLKVEKIVEIISGSLRRLLKYSTVAYMLIETTAEGKKKITFKINLEQPVNKEFIADVRGKMLDSLNALVGKDFKNSDVEETISGTITDPTSTDTVGSYFNVPIVISGEPVGVLNIASTRKSQYNQSEVDILYTIMSQASDAVSKLQAVLNVEKGKLNSMVTSMADGVVMIDNQKQLYVINTTAKEMLGIEAEKPSIFDVLDSLANVFDLRTKLEESIDHDKLVVVPAVTLKNHFLQVLISPVKDKEKSYLGAVVLFHDITKEKELEKMREDFTSMMVHELRSPLTGIKGIAGLLNTDRVKSDPKKYAEFVSLITTNTEDMLGLVNDLLDVAKLESGKFQLIKKSTDLKNLLVQRMNSFKAVADQSSLSMEVAFKESTPQMVEIDEHKIIQVINNFVSNAIKFTRTGGKITLSSFKLDKGKDLAQVVVENGLVWAGVKKGIVFPEDRIIVGVTDTGEGITQEGLSKLFNKFVQLESSARSEKKGTGLGLVVSKGIVEAHKGAIGVFSEPGEGSTFYFALPI